MIPGGFSWLFAVPGKFLMIPGGFSGFFTVPGRFFMNTGGLLWLFIVPHPSFHDSRLAFVVIRGSMSVMIPGFLIVSDLIFVIFSPQMFFWAQFFST